MNTTAPERAGRREWTGLAVLVLPTLLVSMDLTVLHLAVPVLSADLRPTGTQLLWITDIYGFLIAGCLITMGALGDRIGRRRLLLTGGAAFGVASVLAALSTSAEVLVVTRGLLGVAGATLMPSTLSLIRHMFHDPAQRTFAISTWMTTFMVGGAIGPLVGGALLERFWWGSVFLLAVPVMLLLLVLGPVLLPEYRAPGAGRIDVLSVPLSLVAVLTVVYGIKRLAEHGADGIAAVAVLVGLAVGALFLRRQRVLDDPLIDLRLFSERTFSAALSTQTLGVFAMAGTQFFINQYLQLVEGLSPLEAGLWTLPSTVSGIVGAMLAPVVVRTLRPAYTMAVGLVLAALGFATMTQVDGDAGLAVLVTGFVVSSFGLGPTMTLTTDMIIGSAPPERAGAASAVSETGSEFGLAMGLAVIGSVGTAVYRADAADAVPDGLPADAAEAARDTLGGAVDVAGRLPAEQAARLLEGTRDAFTGALHTTAFLSCVVTLGLVVLVMTTLRRVPVGAGAQGHGEAPPEDGEGRPENTPREDTPRENKDSAHGSRP
ncbi:MFS transporter [Streptomyces macrosporus]|uniref:MFS transporter n=1 Tax=Streptomyces macrosporus TaxID=44032 RepID=A0ABP5WJY2_9ACTN